MHELSIALSIVDGVLEELDRQKSGQVEIVHLRVGRMSGVDRDALSFSYGVACEGTVLANSRLLIEDVDVAIFCSSCGVERPILSFPLLICAECGAAGGRLLRGEELEITAMEMSA
ncbi:MAG TPA: hydrogenase maturation nickel metallochaperone HypA [Terriglobales bacterium]|jgi:hydrogenase nickel incorporation protein HypA/HybF|nr:hydrogenase maturation nickel metallochaperone HypA [Terriglobales bacterium]